MGKRKLDVNKEAMTIGDCMLAYQMGHVSECADGKVMTIRKRGRKE